jgi:stage V sporulation protein G
LEIPAMTEAATTIVNFTVLDVEPIRGAGRLIALARVELELDGVILIMQGIRVVRMREGILTEPPKFRDPRTGDWIPALIVPAELGEAIARELNQVLFCERRNSPGADLLAAVE